MTDIDIEEKILDLKKHLTGDLFADGSIQQAIYDLKKQLRPEIEDNPELDDYDDECLSCGA
jgi:hypothetical protein